MLAAAIVLLAVLSARPPAAHPDPCAASGALTLLGVAALHRASKHGAVRRDARPSMASRRLRREVRALARAEEQRRLAQTSYQVLIDSIDGIVWQADATTVVFQFVSKQAERLLGYPTARWLDEPTFWADHIHPDDRTWCLEFCARATAELRAHQLEYRMIAADGRTVWLHDLVTIVVEGGRAVALRGIMIDVTERKRIEAELAESRVRLEALAAERGRLLDEAQRALRVRDVFLTVTSHVLKTPLTPLRLNLQFLAGQLGKSLADERLAGRVEVALRQTDRLSRLIHDLLDVTRSSTGKLLIDPVATDVAALVRGVATRFEGEAARARCALVLRADGPAVAAVDPPRLEQVLANLLTNAVLYGAGKPVVVSVVHGPDTVRVVVEDQGIGVAPEDRERIFGLFERGVSEQRYGGLGLGLYIAREIVEAHGGRIGCSCSPGAGARFEVELPVTGAAARQLDGG